MTNQVFEYPYVVIPECFYQESSFIGTMNSILRRRNGLAQGPILSVLSFTCYISKAFIRVYLSTP